MALILIVVVLIKKSIDDNNSTIMITIFIVGNLRTKIMIIATIIISQRRSIFRGHFELL